MKTQETGTVQYERVMDPRDAKRVFKFEDQLEERIDAGVDYLDGRFGKKGWLPRLNEHMLDLGDAKVCVTGQLFGDFFENFLEQGKMNTREAIKLGFLLKKSEKQIRIKFAHKEPDDLFKSETYIDGYNMLTSLWFARLKTLRRQRKVAYTGA